MSIVDWEFHFDEGNEWGHSCDIRSADPTSDVSLEEPSAEDIVRIFGEDSDEGIFWAYGELKDGRFFVYDEWWDYTFSGGSLTLAKSREEIERYGLSAEQRRQLGIVLPKLEA